MARHSGTILAATWLAAISCAATVTAAEPRVSFEILTRQGLAPQAAQQWNEALSSLGVAGLRIQSGGDSVKPDVQATGTADAPAFKVTGILAADNMLYVPGGKFGVRDLSGLRQWIAELADAGVEGVTMPRQVFGLTPSELAKVDADLRRPLGFATRGLKAQDVAKRIADRLRIPFHLDGSVNAALARTTIADDLSGLTCGTALAVVLRAAGLSFFPERQRGETLHYRVGRAKAGSDTWPAGWKPEKRPADVLPALYEMLNVEIADIPVSEAIEAIQGRLAVPFLFDRSAMAMHGADPMQVQAKVPAKRLSYSQVLSQVLSQARLRYEVRVDEAQRPFLWITTVKPAP